MSFMNFENFVLGTLDRESVRNLLFKFVARRWVAGNDLEDAIERAKILNKDGITAIINHVGEHITNQEQGKREREEYFRIIDAIVANGIKASVSLKPSQLIATKNLADLIGALEPIVKKAMDNGVIVCIDMENSEYTLLTIDVYKILFGRGYKNLQIVIQTYMHRTPKDLEELEKIGAKVRLCKGAYRTESQEIIIKKHEEICMAFVSRLDEIFRFGKLELVSVATHDEEIIQKVKKLNKKYPCINFEFQMLIGMNDKLMHKLAEERYAISAYVPYGKNWIPYFYRRVKENKDYVTKAIKSLF